MDNQQIATIFEEIGQLLEIDGANRFRVLAYKNVAENIRGMGRELKDLYNENTESIGELPGVGFDLQSKITEILNTGFCQFHQELVKKYGRGLLEILQIRSVGPKKAALFYKELKIDNLEKLKAAALAGKLSQLPRMGEKSEQEILQAIEERSKYSTRMLLSQALPLAEKIIHHMKKAPGLTKLSYAGSLRRRKETVGDLDILAAPENIDHADILISHFQKFPLIKNIIANGPTKCSVIMENGVQADLRVVEEKSFGAALHYFTGSKDHNVEIRSLAIKAHKKINEYGIFDLVKNGDTIEEKFIIGDSEENLYKAVGLSFIPPTLRENRGEFEACLENKLPHLIELSNLQGDLNVNSNYADGENSLEEICQAFQKTGDSRRAVNIVAAANLQYFAVNDTFSTSEIPSTFTAEKLKKQLTEIQVLQKKYPQLKILKSLKIPINSDGSLDLPSEELLKQLDFLTIKIAHNFNLPEPRQTARIIQALSSHPKVKLLSCPTARILNQREAIALNLEKIITVAVEKKILLEINSQPDHLDLPDFQIKTAIQKGALLSINSDLKNINQIEYLQYGVWTAQRGWAEAKNIINTLPYSKLINFISH